jgi:hypothetical protein
MYLFQAASQSTFTMEVLEGDLVVLAVVSVVLEVVLTV